MGEVAFIKDEQELNLLLEDESLLVMDCTASWCGPCKLVAPLMDKLAGEYSDRLRVFKLDVDANQDISKRFGIRSIPAVIYFKGGSQVEMLVGVRPYEEFTSAAERFL
ncbi:MAG: thioredoxin domain-containing protein [Cyanobacteria bacterium J06641_5]